MATDPDVEFLHSRGEIRPLVMPERPSYFVIVGWTIAEATGKYHELYAAGDERVRGTPIRLAVAQTAIRHCEGLRVHGYEFTDHARSHPHAYEIELVLERSVVLGNYRNNPQTGEQ
jgi:hypothetical protein